MLARGGRCSVPDIGPAGSICAVPCIGIGTGGDDICIVPSMTSEGIDGGIGSGADDDARATSRSADA